MKLVLFWLIVVPAYHTFSQPDVSCSFPPELNESSGLEWVCGELFSHNDSGDTTRIFRISESGILLEKIYLQNTTHLDWEDIAFDAQNNVLFVGDLGSNNYFYERPNRVIYAVDVGSLTPQDSIGVIFFGFEDYTDFTDHSNFDCEAMIVLDHFIFLFTKNHGTSGYSKIYRLNRTGEVQTAILIDSIYTLHPVTAADSWLNQVALLTEFEVILLVFENGLFTTYTEIDLISQQFEGIAFKNKNELLISAENSLNQLYSLQIGDDEVSEDFVYVPSADFIAVRLNPDLDLPKNIQVFSETGQLVVTNKPSECACEILIGTSDLPGGAYVVSIERTNGSSAQKIVLP